MKLALLFLGLAAAYLLIGWLVSFPIRFRSLYAVQSENQSAGPTGGRLRSAQHGLWSGSKAAVG